MQEIALVAVDLAGADLGMGRGVGPFIGEVREASGADRLAPELEGEVSYARAAITVLDVSRGERR